MGIQVQPCCCPDCTILSDSFIRADSGSLGADWTEDAGSWAIASNMLETTSSNARAFTTASNPDNFKGKVTATFKRDNLVTGDEVKLFVSTQDASNTFYAVFKAADAGGSGGTAKMYDGAGTQQGTTVALPSFKAGVAGNSTFSLCFNGHTLIVNTDDGNEAADTGSAGYGDLAGVGTGSISGTVDITQFAYSKYQTDGDSCPTCTVPCDLLCTGAVPLQWKIEWSGLINANDQCEDCFDLDSGTMYIDFNSYFAPFPSCNWGDAFFPNTLLTNCDDFAADCDLGGVGDAPAGYLDVLWRCKIIYTGGHYWLIAEFVIGCQIAGVSQDITLEFWYDLGTSKPDCNALTTPITVPFLAITYEDGDGTTDQVCKFNTTTVTVMLSVVPA